MTSWGRCFGSGGSQQPASIETLDLADVEVLGLTVATSPVEIARLAVPEDFGGLAEWDLVASGRNGASTIGAAGFPGSCLVTRDGAGAISTSQQTTGTIRTGGFSSPSLSLSRVTDGSELVWQLSLSTTTNEPVDVWISGTIRLRAGRAAGV